MTTQPTLTTRTIPNYGDVVFAEDLYRFRMSQPASRLLAEVVADTAVSRQFARSMTKPQLASVLADIDTARRANRLAAEAQS